MTEPITAALTLGQALQLMLEDFAAKVRARARSAATLTMHGIHVRWLERELGEHRPIREIDEAVIDGLVERARATISVRGAPLNDRTIQKRLTTLGKALRLAYRRRAIDRLPLLPEWAFPPPERKHRIIETFEEFRSICQQLPLARASWFTVAFWTCQRAADVERATWSDVKLDADPPCILIRHTKNRRGGRWVKAPAQLVEHLRQLREDIRRRTGHDPDPSARLVKAWPTRYMQLGRVCVRLGLQPVTATGLRHTSVTQMVRRKGITPAAQKWGGWGSLAMMERYYADALPADLASTADELARFASGPRRGPHAAPSTTSRASRRGESATT